jgi:redox-sensitive bicupin YhaK (pirin superfamily)
MNAEDVTTVKRTRQVERLVTGQATSDGAGVRLVRVLTGPLQRRLDPFLMLDAFGSDDPDDYIAGFPDHPHRGFETVTYMLTGRMLHRDSAGNEGLLESGDVQWMTAGRGVIHSEIPQQADGVMEGFQLWLNLPAREKMRTPWYRDIKAAELPVVDTAEGAHLVVIAGSAQGVTGAVTREASAPLYLDVHLRAGGRLAQPLPAAHNAFAYVYRGEARIGGQAIPSQRMAILENSTDADGVVIEAGQPTRLLLIAGRPLGEPIVQHGPFVMNSREEIYQAFLDYQAGRLGESAETARG